MNFWKPVGLIAIGIAAILAWMQFAPGAGITKDAGTSDTSSVRGNQQASSTTSGASGRGSQGSGQARSGQGRGRPPALVVAQPAIEALINDRLKAVGSGMAKASVSVAPLSGGLLEEVLVSSGEYINKGDVLARLDNEEQQIARDRAARLVDNAAIEESRLAKLFRSRTASEADLIRARAALTDARLALRDSELTLARREIKAPVAGFVGLIDVDQGNFVTPQTELVTIDDRSTIVLEFWVPERFSDQVAIGQSIEATSQANPAVVHRGTITGIGSRIETDSRTLPVQAELGNGDDTLRPGMAFNINLNFTGQSYPAVDPLAIQWDSKGSYVWVLEESKVKRVPVQIIQRNPESVLVAGALEAGEKVVTEGLMRLRPGASVREQGVSSNRNNNTGS